MTVFRILVGVLFLITTFSQILTLGQENTIYDSSSIVEKETDSTSLPAENNIKYSKKDSVAIPELKKNESGINLYILIPFIAALLAILWKISEIIKYVKQKLSISEKRYLKEIIKKYNMYENFTELDIKILSNEEDLPKDEIDKQTIRLNDLVIAGRSVQIIGQPGSGKTSILKKLLLFQCKLKLENRNSLIPIYLEFRGKDVFERIIEFLYVNQFSKDITVINQNWLKKKLLTGKFLFLIDDIHKLIDAESPNEEMKMRELLDYNKNQFVLMGRDFMKLSMFGFELYQVAQLTENKILDILKLYSNEQEAHLIYQNFRWDKKLRELYSTPQMLMFLSRVYRKYNRIPSNKAQIFTEYLEIKKKQEFSLDVEAMKMFEKHVKILSYLALQMFENDANSYWITFDECLALVNDENNRLIKRGYQNISTEIIINVLLKQGFLIRIEDKIRYTHDQWQEFFAAKQMFEKRLPLNELKVKQSRDEILFFLSGLHTYLGDEVEKEYCNLFLTELSKENFFLFYKCLKNYDLRWLIKDWEDFFKDKIFTQEQIKSNYEEFFKLYNEIIDIHFKELKIKFTPFTTSNSGLLVEYDDLNKSCWYGFREKNEEKEIDLIFLNKFDANNIFKFNTEGEVFDNYYRKYNLKSWQSKSIDPNIYKLPAIGAFEDINDQLKKIIKEKKLIENEEMDWERLFYEAFALKNKLRISKNKDSISVKDISDGLKKMEIENYLFNKRLHKNGIVPNLENEIDELFENNFIVTDKPYSTTYSGIYNRRINDKEFERLFSDLVASKNLKATDLITPPIPNLPYNLDPWRSQKLNEQEIEMLLNWANSFQEKVFKNYFSIIETNFPTSKYLFKTYKSKPICIVLSVDPNKITKSEYLGRRYFYANVSNQKNDVEVILVRSISEYEKIHSKLKHHLSWSNPYWGFGFSFPRKEPLRESVYDIIEREYKDLIR